MPQQSISKTFNKKLEISIRLRDRVEVQVSDAVSNSWGISG